MRQAQGQGHRSDVLIGSSCRGAILAGLLVALSAADCPAAVPRPGPLKVGQCALVARDNSAREVYQHACAEALQRVELAPWQETCDEVSAPNLLEALTEDRGGGRRPRVHTLGKGRFLLEVPCRSGAYNQSSLFFGYDETRLPAPVTLLEFPQPDGVPRAEVFARAVDGRRRWIVEYRKARGLGDAGYYARYAVDPTARVVTLNEAIAKDAWDGKAAFHWTGAIGRKPHGEGWKRVWPVVRPK